MPRDTETNMLLNQPKSIQSTASIDVESQEKQAAKDQEQQSFWDRWFGDSAEEKDEKERKAFMEDPNLSPQVRTTSGHHFENGVPGAGVLEDPTNSHHIAQKHEVAERTDQDAT